MAGGKRREPINLIIAKNKKHLTKQEIEERKAQELNVPFKDIVSPSYLTAKQKKEFNEYAEKLLELDILTELDVDILAQYCIAKTLYLKYSEQIKKILDTENSMKKWNLLNKISDNFEDAETLKKLLEMILRRQRGDDITVIMNLQDKAFKQMVTCARELGLTITSRLKLAIPPPPDNDDDEL